MTEDNAAALAETGLSKKLRGFGPLGIVSILIIFGSIVFSPLTTVLVLLWAKMSRTPWREVGYYKPKNLAVDIVAGIIFGVVLKLAMKTVVMPLLGADPVNQAYQFLTGNAAALPGMIFTVVAGAGFGEESLFRGFAFERLGKLIGRGTGAKIATVLITTLIFGILHFPGQSLPGVANALVVGLVFGAVYALRNNLWLLITTHIFFDLTAVFMVYYNLETFWGKLIYK